MRHQRVFIPYGRYWSTPFVKWQGAFAHLHALRFAAEIASSRLAEMGIDLGGLGRLILGSTVPQRGGIHGAAWMAGLLGAPDLPGLRVDQACATPVTALRTAAHTLELGETRGPVLVLTADRSSASPHIYYPGPGNVGGVGESEDFLWDAMMVDSLTGRSWLAGAERTAKAAGIERAAQEETTLIRHEQYKEALADDAAFQRRYMVRPVKVMDPSGRKALDRVEGDEGIFPATVAGLSRLRPGAPGGTVTFGTQAYPADGNAGILATDRENARRLSRDPGVEVRVLAFGEARSREEGAARASVLAAKQALGRAGLGLRDLRAVKTHQAFAVQDVFFAWEMELPLNRINRYGCSLVHGHALAATGTRTVIELIEELVLAGGGYGLFACGAADDGGAALVIKVDSASRRNFPDRGLA